MTIREEAGLFQRRLVELGLDVHDGPLQDLSALRLDLQLFRSQLADVLRARAAGDEERVLGRIEDLTARLEAAEEELRRLASLAGSSTLLAGPLSAAVRHVAAEHCAGVELDVRLDPRIDEIVVGDEERIALLRFVQAALSNVERHSGGRHATLTAACGADEVWFQVADDGLGFDVETAMECAAEAGRLGLFGMHERIAELGGDLVVESVVGGGTRVTALLPRRP